MTRFATDVRDVLSDAAVLAMPHGPLPTPGPAAFERSRTCYRFPRWDRQP
jgi:hypothetical protein